MSLYFGAAEVIAAQARAQDTLAPDNSLDAKMEAHMNAKAKRNQPMADAIRAELEAAGVEVEDWPSGVTAYTTRLRD